MDSKVLNISGSNRLVSDYFEICIHNILFQRKVYPKEDFKVIRKFGLNLVYSQNQDVIDYIKQIIKQLHRWISEGKINFITFLIVSKETNQISEKWMFHIDFIDKNNNEKILDENIQDLKPLNEIQREIQTIIRQISSSIAILPEFEEPQTFKILVHTTSNNLKTPNNWDDAKPFKDIQGDGIENVKFENLSTNNHKISTFVTYQTREQ